MKKSPTRLNEYELLEEVGRGGMGAVYRGRNTNSGEEVAIKILHPEFLVSSDGSKAKERFRREAEAARRLSHRNVVSVLASGEAEGHHFIVMEFVTGCELRSLVASRQIVGEAIAGGGRLAIPTACEIVSQVLEGLEHAHANNIVHRDIKPSNMLVLPDGTAKISDFGVAWLDDGGLTTTGRLIGTPSYMAPEQFQERPADARSDLFSVGVVLYELLAGQRPFAGSDTIQLMYSVTTTNPMPVSRFIDGSPTNFDGLLRKSLEKLPENRFQCAREFRQALIEAQQGAFNSFALSDAQIREAEVALARHLGPLAKVATKRAADEARTLSSFYRILAEQLPVGTTRDDFLSLCPEVDADGDIAVATIDGDQINRLEAELTNHLGPIARVIIKRAVRNCSTLSELVNQVAMHIESQEERTKFIKLARSSLSFPS